MRVQGRRKSRRAGTPAGALAALLALGGCEIPKEVNPVVIWREVSGAADAGRERPPGLDQPWPSLGTVPPRPERPDSRTREAISAGLADDRGASRQPLTPRVGRDPPPGEAAPGAPALPAAPPPRARLGQAASIPWSTPGFAPQGRQAAEPPAGPPTLPEPGLAPEAPPPDLLGLPAPGSAPAPPPAELLAPPPPR